MRAPALDRLLELRIGDERPREIPDELVRDMAHAPCLHEGEINGYVAAGGRIHRHHDPAEEPPESELAILRCLSHGMTTTMAAEALHRSPETIHRQLKGARYRLRAKNTMHALAIALRRGLIE